MDVITVLAVVLSFLLVYLKNNHVYKTVKDYVGKVDDVSEKVVNFVDEAQDPIGAVRKALADDKISPDEIMEFLKEVDEAKGALEDIHVQVIKRDDSNSA